MLCRRGRRRQSTGDCGDLCSVGEGGGGRVLGIVVIYVLYLGEGGGGRVLGIVVIYVLYLGEGEGGRVLGIVVIYVL